ncbi:hypothetical protein ABZT28_45920, partial [Streptomyces sp. NPDC005388]
GEYLLGGATSSSFPCSGQPYWVPVRKLRGPSTPCSRKELGCEPSPAGLGWPATPFAAWPARALRMSC